MAGRMGGAGPLSDTVRDNKVPEEYATVADTGGEWWWVLVRGGEGENEVRGEVMIGYDWCSWW